MATDIIINKTEVSNLANKIHEFMINTAFVHTDPETLCEDIIALATGILSGNSALALGAFDYLVNAKGCEHSENTREKRRSFYQWVNNEIEQHSANDSILESANFLAISGYEDLPDDLDWAIMIETRELAKKMELFNPAMYAATAGKAFYAIACEVPDGVPLIANVSNNDGVRAQMLSKKTVVCASRAELLAALDNYKPYIYAPGDRYVIFVKNGESFKLAMTEGRDLPDILPEYVFEQVADGSPIPTTVTAYPADETETDY